MPYNAYKIDSPFLNIPKIVQSQIPLASQQEEHLGGVLSVTAADILLVPTHLLSVLPEGERVHPALLSGKGLAGSWLCLVVWRVFSYIQVDHQVCLPMSGAAEKQTDIIQSYYNECKITINSPPKLIIKKW